jgi:hypothetical protein
MKKLYTELVDNQEFAYCGVQLRRVNRSNAVTVNAPPRIWVMRGCERVETLEESDDDAFFDWGIIP